MKIVNKRPEDLRPYKNNPRINDGAVDAVAASIREFGFKVPIVISPDSEIICGHTRQKAALRLHLKTVPCVIADDLSDEQIKAFRLADNKTAEIADWDISLLNAELKEVCGIDMEEFGFPSFDDDDEDEEDEGGYYGDERERNFNATNFNDYDEERVEGRYDMPTLLPCDEFPERLIGFNYARTSEDYGAWIHFYIDDYQFERLWNSPAENMNILQRFGGCLTPNFSIYRDMPEAMKIWNTYRARLLGQIMQDCGINVIPIVYWSDKRSFDYCFDGLPENATLSVNNIRDNTKEAKKLWDDGMDELIKRKSPSRILLYGTGRKEDYDFGDIEVVTFRNSVTERMRA